MASRHGMIKVLLKRYKYLPDQEPATIELVLQQPEMISEEWASEDLGDKFKQLLLMRLHRTVPEASVPRF